MAEQTNKRSKLLLVDSSEIGIELLRGLSSSVTEIRLVDTTNKAIEALAREHFDVVLCHAGIDENRVASFAKRRFGNGNILTVIYTGSGYVDPSGRPPDYDVLMQRGHCDGYVTSPIRKELSDRIREVLIGRGFLL